MTEKEILIRFIAALSAFYEKDNFLLDCNASERSMTHRLAVYLEHLFPNYNVDCEYNRIENDIKKVDELKSEIGVCKKTCEMCDEKCKVFPDIIVHKRGEKVNILVIEAKKHCSEQERSYDFKKLDALTKSSQYKYTLGIGFCFNGELNDTIQSIKLFPKENDKIKQLEECLKFMIFGNKKCTQRKLHVQK